MVFNIILLILWGFLTVAFFVNPQEHYSPNWVSGIVALTFVLRHLTDIIKQRFKKG